MTRKSFIATISMFVAAIVLSTAAIAKAYKFQDKDKQTANVEVTAKGFEPSSLKLKSGVPAKVTFVRKSDDTCADDVVIKDYNIERKLPLNEPVTVEFTPRKGEFTFGCGMNMVKGKLVVE
jgi:plastocyanin domain-containing protein